MKTFAFKLLIAVVFTAVVMLINSTGHLHNPLG